MGEVLRSNKPKLIIFIPLFFTILSAIEARASLQEIDLVNSGYEYYLSYQPEKAVEEFKIFLKEFPDSSVRDAVMFWLGKSSMQLKDFEEAKKVFSALMQQFPESPYIKYVKRELEAIDRTRSEDKGGEPAGAIETAAAEKRINIPEMSPEDAERKEQSAENTQQQRTNVETDSVKVEEEKPPVEPETIDRTRSEDKGGEPAGAIETAAPEIKIAKKSEPLQPEVEGRGEVEGYATDSSYVFSRLGIKDILWRNGNISEDIEDEMILYEEAKRLNIYADAITFEGLVLKYGFNSGQADYLKRYLTICELLDRKLKDVPEERVIESLIVKYEEVNKYRKIVISPELQREAKRGVSFEEIQKLYPDLIRVVITGYDAVNPELKEKILNLQNDEIGVIWSEEGYMIIKPVLKKLSCKPFEEAGPGIRDKIKAFITELLVALKRSRGPAA